MNFWWVNQGQTSAQEIGGGYLWSPKLQANGQRTKAYDNMKEIEPGDIVLSYANMKVGNYGIATGRAVPSPKPEEFGKLGMYWSNDGWFVPIKWYPIEPIDRDFIGKNASKLFRIYENPFDINGAIKQRYLFQIDKEAVDFVLGLAKVTEDEFVVESLALEPAFFSGENALDGVIESQIVQNTTINETEKEAVVQARRGQGRFRENLSIFEKRCRITGVEDHRILVASHIKPWRSCASNFERLDGNNGLLLTPTMDKLFDRRYLTFESNGDVLLSKKLTEDTYERIGLNPGKKMNVGPFKEEQEKYLTYHRDIFLG